MGNMEDDVQTITDIRNRTMHAENAGDTDFFHSVCAEDIVVMPPGMPAIVGRSAAVGFMKAFLGEVDLSILYVSEEILVCGDIAYDRGTFAQTLVMRAGGDPISETGKFLRLYARASDGTWKMSRIIWNTSNSPQNQ